MRNQVIIFRLFSISTLVGISLLLLGSCNGQINPVDADSEPAFYPNAVGSRWVYGWYNGAVDSIEGTWSREIVGHERILGGMSVSVQEVKNKHITSTDTIDIILTEFVYVDKDSLVIFGSRNGSALERLLKIMLPITVGDTVTWGSDPFEDPFEYAPGDFVLPVVVDTPNWGNDSVGEERDEFLTIPVPPTIGVVVAVDTTSVLAGAFTNTFQYDVHSRESYGSSFITTSYWIVPEFGILKSVDIACPYEPYSGRPDGGDFPSRGCLRDFSGELIEFSLAGQ